MSAKIHQCCKALAKNGKPCRAAATASGLCFFHANPDKASELGRLGGRNKRSTVSEGLDPLPALTDAIAVRDALPRLITDLQTGKIHPKTGAGLARLLSLQLRTIERVEKLEVAATPDPREVSLGERMRQAHERMERFAREELIERASALAKISSRSSGSDPDPQS